MKAWVQRDGDTAPALQRVDVAGPQKGEVRVRIHASGVCGSDLAVMQGRSPVAHYPVILGHEGAGVVEELGPGVEGINVGDHVVVALYGPCLACASCLSGDLAHCGGQARVNAIWGMMADQTTRMSDSHGPLYPFVGAGTLAEQVVVRASQLVVVAPDVPLDVICLAGCGVTTGLGAVFNVAEVGAGETVLVVGCGGVGLSVIQGARIAGAGRIIALDTNAGKLDLAGLLGATDTVHLGEGDDLAETVASLVPGGVDVAFEVVGNPDVVAACVGVTRAGGRCVMVGSPPSGSTIPVDGRVLFSDRKLMGTTGGSNIPARDIPRIVDLYRSGSLRLDEMVSQRFRIDRADQAFAATAAGEVARSVVVMDASTATEEGAR